VRQNWAAGRLAKANLGILAVLWLCGLIAN